MGIMWLVVIGTSIWVYADAKSNGARKGLIPGWFDSGPGGWLVGCLLLWIVYFPVYLSRRSRIKDLAGPRLAEPSADEGSSTNSTKSSTDEEGVLFTLRGTQDTLKVTQDKVAITPRGIWGFLNKGLKGTKSIPFTSITAIQIKESGFTSGYIQFTVPGGNESTGGLFAATKDENTFMFAGKAENVKAKEIVKFIESRIAEIRTPGMVVQQSSLTDRISELAKLKQNGILSEEEFQAAKEKALGI